ncbi:MAG: helix-turn-helix domain-containing protein, partial [Nitrospinota bacterium]
MAKVTATIEEGLGPFLRQEREARGILLAEISKQTRVRNFYLEAIEAGDYRRLPAVPIARGFVRAYARAIGVDSDAAARQFDREFGKPREAEKEAERSGETIVFSQIAQRPGGHPKMWIPFAAAASLILISGVVFWSLRGKTEQYVPVTSLAERLKAAAGPMLKQMPSFLTPAEQAPATNWSGESRPAVAPAKPGAGPQSLILAPSEKNEALAAVGRPSPGNAPTMPIQAPPAAAGNHFENPRVPAAGAQPAPPAAAPSPAPPAEGKLALKIRAVEDTWVRIVVDQREIQEFLLTAGNERFWKGA